MRTGSRLAVIVSCAVTVALAGCGRHPDGFADVRWGASETLLRKSVPLESCGPSGAGSPGPIQCRATSAVRFGGVQPRELLFYLRDGNLVAWRLTYPAGSRDQMSQALAQRHGKPTSTDARGARWVGSRGQMEVEFGAAQDIVIARGERRN